MPAARYWRAIGIAVAGGQALELSALHLYNASTRVDGPAVLTCALPPSSGALSQLSASAPTQVVRWDEGAMGAAGFALVWDFGADQAVTNVLVGAGSQPTCLPTQITLQHSTDGAVWITLGTFGRWLWPGPLAMAEAPSGGIPGVHFLAHFDDGVAEDNSGNNCSVALQGGAALATSGGRFAGRLNCNGGGAVVTGVPAFGAGDFCISMWVLQAGTSKSHILTFGNPGFNLAHWSAGKMSFYRYDTGAAVDFAVPSLIDVLRHLEISRVNGVLRVFVDGVLRWSIGDSTPLGVAPVYLGMAAGVGGFDGALDEVLVGTGGNSANFTPPSAPYESVFGPGPGPALAFAAHAAVAASAVVSPHSAPAPIGVICARDVEHGGPGTIYGTTKTKGTPNAPTKARVVLQHQRSKLPVRETWSDPTTGYFEFRGIDASQQFLTLAEDEAGNFQSVAANRLTPEVLP